MTGSRPSQGEAPSRRPPDDAGSRVGAIPLPPTASGIVWKALSHLLVQREPLRRKLAAHPHSAVRLTVRLPGGIETRTDGWIDPGGYLQAGPSPEPSGRQAELVLQPSGALPFDWVREGRQGLARHVQIEGDILVGGALAEVLSQVRWDYEEDLSRVVGDMAAHRIGGGIRRAAEQGRRLGESLLEVVGRRASHAGGPAISRDEFDAHVDALKALADRVRVLEG